ncbi:MAG TPA: hypothetical protein VFU21_02480 [Kofleriaceae bacterium]|nr:hypothetical protein [Kofleriaceae bacterium]
MVRASAFVPLLAVVACSGDVATGPGPDAGGAAGSLVPDFILEDPGFAEELEEIGWDPWEPAAGLADVPGDGDEPPASVFDDVTDPRAAAGRDRFGGLTGSGLQTSATGFFHIERPRGAERVWLVDPEGNPWFGVGINTVLRTANVPEIDAYLRRMPDFNEVARVEWDRMSTGAAGGFGYFFNSTPGFATENDVTSGINPITRHAPYGERLPVSVPIDAPFVMKSAGGKVLGASDASATLGDPFNPAYRDHLAAAWAPQIRRDDPNLIVYWLDNEIGLFDWPLHLPPGTRDMRTWIWSACPAGSSIDQPACAPHALGRFLRDRYRGDPARLSRAWGKSFASFDAVIAARPTPGSEDAARRCEGECEQDMQRFQRVLWRKWVVVWTGLVRELDPNHLVGSPRMAVGNSDLYCFWGIDGCLARFTDGRRVRAGSGVTYSPFALFRRNGPYGFDLIAVNAYSRADRRGYDTPWLRDGFHTMMRESALPIFVSEFGVRARIEGWTNSGGATAFVPPADPEREQELRGEFYAWDMAQFGNFRGVVGASFHRWADRYVAEEQMNMGVVHRDGSRWAAFDDRIRRWNIGTYGRLDRLTGW